MIFFFSSEKITTRYRRKGYNLNVMRQSACSVFNPIMVDNFAAFYNCTPVGRASDYDGPDIKLFILVGWGWSFLSVAWPTGAQHVFFFCSGFQYVIRRPAISIVGQLTEYVESSFLNHQGGFHDLFVHRGQVKRKTQIVPCILKE